ncbi:MAG: hypothetical protein KA444_07680 [Bacteroidia bacterium]|nr:hypothetical protein [Bacteroidia bacterium]
MKKFVLVLISGLVFSIPFGFAVSSEVPTVKEQLENLNACWKVENVSSPVLNERIELNDDVDIIQVHLSLV